MLLPSFCLFLGLTGNLSSSLIITGTHYIAIPVPFLNCLYFNHLRRTLKLAVLHSGRYKVPFIPKTVELNLQRWHFGQ
jgi:hypothetical protein